MMKPYLYCPGPWILFIMMLLRPLILLLLLSWPPLIGHLLRLLVSSYSSSDPMTPGLFMLFPFLLFTEINSEKTGLVLHVYYISLLKLSYV